MKLNKKAFKILTEDEKASLALQKVHGKSTWEAGGILNRSHYKYLEIKQRAERFFELFTLHYDTHGSLIPDGLPLTETFQMYLHYVIEKRMTVKEASAKIGIELMIVNKQREAFIEAEMNKLKSNNSILAQHLYTVIMEFDRYNNFRILPRSIQEPSAFKRRNKTRYRKHLTISTTIHPYTLMRIKELYEYKKGPKPNVLGWIILANFENPENIVNDIITIPVNDKTLKELSSISIYIFPSEDLAKEYLELVTEYLIDPEKDPRKGLIFWPKFRNLIKESYNYNHINNIAPSRVGTMTSLKDLDIHHYRRRKEAENKKLHKLN